MAMVVAGTTPCFGARARDPSATGSVWLLVAGLAGHGPKNTWQQGTHYVANTRWWRPFCAAVDFGVAALLAAVILAGADLHRLTDRRGRLSQLIARRRWVDVAD